MYRSGRTLSLVLGGALVASSSALASNSPAAPPQSGFAPALEFVGIRDIQHQLAARGYDPGPATGTITEATSRAIIAYQQDYGLAQDGIAGPVVQNALHFMPRRPAPAALAALTPPGAAPSAAPPPLAPPVAAAPPAPEPSPGPPAPPQDAAAPAQDIPAAKEAALEPAPPEQARPALGPLDPKPKASPRTPVGVGPISDSAAPPAAAEPAASEAAAPAPAAVAVPAAAAGEDAELAKGDEAVREAQRYLKELGYYTGDEDGVMGWPTVEALVKFDAGGAGPTEVIADAHHPDSVWLARLRIAAAAKAAAEKAPNP